MSNHSPSLLILAAGMGSRYGGLKQLDEFGPYGETIIDYSIYDAIEAGFKKLVFIIRKSFAEEFIDRMESRWKGKVEMNYVFQELDHLPGNYVVPESRSKPWGTGHAVWVAKDVIREPFGVINADDFYGREAMKQLYNFLSGKNEFAVIAYLLKNTLSEHGAVNRGICETDKNGFLLRINERKNIHKSDEIYFELDGVRHVLAPETLVSMNMWAFTETYFEWAERYFKNFLSKELNNASAEFYIPELVQYLIDENILKVRVLQSSSHWIGVTYKEDKPAVANAFTNMIKEGLYPKEL
jgi:NDP-sugar pyrophosphorylase family protein